MLEVHVSITAVAVLTVILIIFLIGLLLYLYPTSSNLSTIPGPNVLDEKEGNLNDIERAGSLHQYLREIHDDYGHVVSFKYGQQLVVSISDPSHFAPRSQLFTLPGFLFDRWRPLVGDNSFLFATDIDVFKRRENIDFKMKSSSKMFYAKSFRLLSIELTKKWKSLPEGQHIPLSQHMKGLATKAVCQMLFGDYFKNDVDVLKLHKAWDLCFNEAIASSKQEPTKSKRELEKATTALRNLIQEATEESWKKSGSAKVDTLLDGLLAGSNKGMNEQQMLSDVITLFTIGVQVTSAVLTWSCYYLSTNPDVQNKLREKLRQNKSLDIMPESLNEMKFMKCILKESIRCSEMFSWAGRQQTLDITVDKHIVPKETPVIEALSAAMKCADAWNEPYKFDPSRFMEDEEVKINPLEYMPFAFAASRQDPKTSLVYLLASVTIASIFRDFEIAIAGNKVNYTDLDYEGFAVMPTKEEVWVTTVLPGKKKGDVEIIG